MKKIISLIACLLATLFIFTACGEIDYAGQYSFRMGKEEGKHMGIYLKLTNEAYEQQTENKEKKFSLTIDIGSMMGVLKDLSGDENAGEISLNGYYYITANGKDSRLHMGVGFSLPIYEEPIDIDPSYVEKVIYSTVNDTAATLYIPTSITDLVLQLEWYDYYEEHWNGWGADLKAIYPTSDPISTHPTPELVAIIKASGEEHADFRDYHTIKMGLTKD